MELFAEYPEAHSTICSNLLLDFDLTLEGQPIPGVEDDLSDKDKLETKARILKAMKQKLEQRFFMLCQAARSGDSETVAMLARQGANLDQSDYDGRSAIHIASREGHFKVVEVLLEHDANRNAKDRWGQV
jgi:ankyrin repeat protein